MNEFVLAVVLTVVVELAVLLLLGERRRWVLLSSVPVNVLTNLSLNLSLWRFGLSLGHVAVGELAVVIVEALWYCYFLRHAGRSLLYSVACNTASFAFGLLCLFLC